MAKSNTKHLYPPRKPVPPNHATWQLPQPQPKAKPPQAGTRHPISGRAPRHTKA